MVPEDSKNKLREELRRAGLDEAFLLKRTEELIEAIETNQFRPKNKEKELRKLKQIREVLLLRIQQNQGGQNG